MRNMSAKVVVALFMILVFSCIIVTNYAYAQHKVIIINQEITSKTVQLIFDEMKADRNYRVIINSPGGAAFDMLGILNRIEELQTKGYNVITEIYGYGMSAGAVIFLAGNVRIIHSDATLMVHCARMNNGYSTITIKTVGIDETTQKIFTILDGKIVRMLREKTSLTDQAIEALLYELDATFLTASEALGLGLATVLVKD